MQVSGALGCHVSLRPGLYTTATAGSTLHARLLILTGM